MSAIRAESKRYFAALGAHVARLRRERGMTQAELARALGVSQQAVFAYEIGDRRISVLVLARMARCSRFLLRCSWERPSRRMGQSDDFHPERYAMLSA